MPLIGRVAARQTDALMVERHARPRIWRRWSPEQRGHRAAAREVRAPRTSPTRWPRSCCKLKVASSRYALAALLAPCDLDRERERTREERGSRERRRGSPKPRGPPSRRSRRYRRPRCCASTRWPRARTRAPALPTSLPCGGPWSRGASASWNASSRRAAATSCSTRTSIRASTQLTPRSCPLPFVRGGRGARRKREGRSFRPGRDAVRRFGAPQVGPAQAGAPLEGRPGGARGRNAPGAATCCSRFDERGARRFGAGGPKPTTRARKLRTSRPPAAECS